MRLAAKNRADALTVLELLIVIGCLCILAAIMLGSMGRGSSYRQAQRIGCANNLKQIGLSFRTWALDNNDKYPPHVAVTNGGTMEFVDSGVVFMHFAVMSNELSTPKVLVCPEETDRKVIAASTFAQSVPANVPNTIPFTNDNNVSYFVGVDADASQPATLLIGDRNLMIGGMVANHGLHVIGTNATAEWFRPRHNGGGNIGLADGSVQQVNSKALRSVLMRGGAETNLLALP
jgi:prepilin-type processing-associated H-X9-DG protein